MTLCGWEGNRRSSNAMLLETAVISPFTNSGVIKTHERQMSAPPTLHQEYATPSTFSLSCSMLPAG